MNTLRYLQLALATCFLLLLNQAHALQVDICQLDFSRLPRRVLPKHYDLDVRISHSSNTFHGKLRIDISTENKSKRSHWIRSLFGKIRKTLFSDSKRIILHADKSLRVHGVGYSQVKNGNGKELKVRKICRDLNKGLMEIYLAKEPRGPLGQLRLNFTGTINQEAEGVYNSSTSEELLIQTCFQTMGARKAFPCFDEPDFKATFNVSIQLPSELTALSIMEPASTERGELDGFKRVRFHTTPKMSTYLLSFAVGKFDHIEDKISGLTIAFWTSPGMTNSVQPLLQTAALAYIDLLKYFEIDQPLKRIDFVTVANSETTKNLDAISVEEAVLLIGLQNLSVDAWHCVELTMVHEFARLWFGYLVTISWWDDMWLNAGFVDWIAHASLARIKPELDSEMFFLLNTMTKALEYDTLESTHPIRDPSLRKAQEIDESFDDIALEKASCLIKMLESYIGPDTFKKGIKEYISRNIYGNTDSDNLWLVLEEQSNLEVANLMQPWIDQAGYPLVEAWLASSTEQTPFELVMRQRRFPPYKDQSSFNQGLLWNIPITILIWDSESSESTTEAYELSSRQGSLGLPYWYNPEQHWLKLNVQFEGFYRVKYEELLYKALKKPVESGEMIPADRLNLIDDAQALFRAGLMEEDQFVKFISWFKYEEDDGVIAGLVKALMALGRSEKAKWGTDILARYYRQNGGVHFNAHDSRLKVKARTEVLQYLVLDARRFFATNDCYKLYRSLTAEGQQVPGPFLTAIYAAVAVEGKDGEVNGLIEKIGQIESRQLRLTVAKTVLKLLRESNHSERIHQIGGQLRSYI